MLYFKKDIVKLSGWLTEAEGTFLYETAEKIVKPNIIVEIGSWKGRSTVCLGRGVQDGFQVLVFAIDPHFNSSKLQRIFNDSISTYEEFIENLKNTDVFSYIRPIQKTSKDASKNFNEPVGFLFIDGDHKFKSINLDYKLWWPKVIDNGVIAFHDTWSFLGPHLVTAKILLFSSKIKDPKLVDTITYFTKVKHNSIFDRTYNVGFLFYRLIFGVRGFLNVKYKGSVVK
jgi:MMP 1-O-methyltransferase